jgi:hypothetical protein
MSGAQLDFSDVDMTDIVANELGARYTNPKVKLMVVSTDPTMAGMVQVFGSLTQLTVHLLPDMDAARTWLSSGAKD